MASKANLRQFTARNTPDAAAIASKKESRFGLVSRNGFFATGESQRLNA